MRRSQVAVAIIGVVKVPRLARQDPPAAPRARHAAPLNLVPPPFTDEAMHDAVITAAAALVLVIRPDCTVFSVRASNGDRATGAAWASAGGEPLGRSSPMLSLLTSESRTTRRANVPAWDDRPVVGDLDDMGGRAEFFGTVVREDDEPVFHARWEARVFGVMTVAGATGLSPNFEAMRDAMRRLPRDVYLASYYRRWLGGVELVLVDQGHLARGEVDARMDGGGVVSSNSQASPSRSIAERGQLLRETLRPSYPPPVAAKELPRRFGTMRPTQQTPRFDVGDPIVVRSPRPAGHTRQPGYVTGKPGVVTAQLGATLFPDALAVGRHEPPQYLYTVAFAGRDLFGDDAEPETEVRVDLYESYLVPA
jgi:nitrile hydratase